MFRMWSALTSLSNFDAACKGEAGESSSAGGSDRLSALGVLVPLGALVAGGAKGFPTRLSLRLC